MHNHVVVESPPHVDVFVLWPRQGTKVLDRLLPTKLVIAAGASHVVTAVSLGKQNAATGAPCNAFVFPERVLSHSFHGAHGGVVR